MQDRRTAVAFFALAVYDYCNLVCGSVTSWGRTPARNRAVGGHPLSKHLDFLGADVVPDDPPPPPAKRREIAEQLGLVLVIEPDHDHLQRSPLP